jgi:hypothetical protein
MKPKYVIFPTSNTREMPAMTIMTSTNKTWLTNPCMRSVKHELVGPTLAHGLGSLATATPIEQLQQLWQLAGSPPDYDIHMGKQNVL